MGLKYKCLFRSLNEDELWKVEIYDPIYSGLPIEKLAAAGSACVIEWDGGDNLLQKHVIPSKATTTLIFNNSEEADIERLQLIGDKTCLVKIYRFVSPDEDDQDLFWQGYVIPDGVQYADSGVDFPVTITAVDMLEASYNIDFTDVEAGAVTYAGQLGSDRNPLNWIRKCLIADENLSNKLRIRWSCSLRNIKYPDDDFFAGRTAFIYNYEEFLASRSEVKVGWLLENIVKSAGCILFQYYGIWTIVDLKDVNLFTGSYLEFGLLVNEDLAAQSASSDIRQMDIPMPTKINENTFSMVQKPISTARATYNHSMNNNIIPNGGFDIIDEFTEEPIYWKGSHSSVVLSAEDPINGRLSGHSLKAINTSVFNNTRYITFGLNGIDSIPLDANVLFKRMQWGFTFMPINYPVDGEGFIDWSTNPLQITMSYTGYRGNIFYTFYLNEFGYWDARNPDGGDGLRVDTAYLDTPLNRRGTVVLSGSAIAGDRYVVAYTKDFGPPAHNTEDVSYTVDFTMDMTLSAAATKIANDTGGIVDLSDIGDGIAYVYYDNNSTPMYWEFLSFSAGITRTGDQQPRISFTVDGLKNNDVGLVQFQSKGNQGMVLMPDPGVLNEMRSLESGKLEMKIRLRGYQEVYFDDVYMNVGDDKDIWEVTDGGSDSVEDYELGISSSFSGFIQSSYMDNFTVSDLSMIMDNGTDRGDLTEIFAKTALRFLSRPTKKIDSEIEGILGGYGMLSRISYEDKYFIPLKLAMNPETNSSKMTMLEIAYNDALAISSVHKSSGDGSGSTGGGGSSGGGGGTGGKDFLFQLGDVSITSPSEGEVLAYDESIGKWVNASGGTSPITNLNQIPTRDYNDLQNKPTIPDVSGKANLAGGNNFIGDQIIAGNLNVSDNVEATTFIGNLSGAATSADTALVVSSINGNIQAGDNVTLDGSGTEGDPFIINATGGDTPTLQEVTDEGLSTTNQIQLLTNIPGLYLFLGGNVDYARFGAYNSVSSQFADVVINEGATGNVGIGTATPTERLDVNGNIKTRGKIILGNGSGAGGLGEIFNHPIFGTIIYPKTGSTNDLTITNGLGTPIITNPTGTNNINIAGELVVNQNTYLNDDVEVTGNVTVTENISATTFIGDLNGQASSSDTIADNIEAGTNVSLSGAGTKASPYVINAFAGGAIVGSLQTVTDNGSSTTNPITTSSDLTAGGELVVDGNSYLNSDVEVTGNVNISEKITATKASIDDAPAGSTDVVRLQDIGGGVILSGSASLDFGIFTGYEKKVLTINISGARDGDVIALGKPNGVAGWPTELEISYWIPFDDTISIAVLNKKATTFSGASGSYTWKVRVFK